MDPTLATRPDGGEITSSECRCPSSKELRVLLRALQRSPAASTLQVGTAFMLFVSVIQAGTGTDGNCGSAREILKLGIAQKRNGPASKRPRRTLQGELPRWATKLSRTVGKLPALLEAFRGNINGASAKLVRVYTSGITSSAAFNALPEANTVLHFMTYALEDLGYGRSAAREAPAPEDTPEAGPLGINEDSSSPSPANDVRRYTSDPGAATAAKLVFRKRTSRRSGGGGGRPCMRREPVGGDGRLSGGEDDMRRESVGGDGELSEGEDDMRRESMGADGRLSGSEDDMRRESKLGDGGLSGGEDEDDRWGPLVAPGRISEGGHDDEDDDGADMQALEDLIAFRREIAAEEAKNEKGE